jgi:hypothetical protein
LKTQLGEAEGLRPPSPLEGHLNTAPSHSVGPIDVYFQPPEVRTVPPGVDTTRPIPRCALCVLPDREGELELPDEDRVGQTNAADKKKSHYVRQRTYAIEAPGVLIKANASPTTCIPRPDTIRPIEVRGPAYTDSIVVRLAPAPFSLIIERCSL